jgi:hypothetical protein
MSENFPKDEFDDVAPATGRRRIKPSGRGGFLEFVTFFSLAAVLSGGGLIGYQTFFGGGTKLDLSGFNETPAKPSVDPLRINETKVFDALGQEGLASTVAHKLLDKGWNVVTAADMPDGAKADKTVIYINSDQLNDAAKALVGDLGNYTIEVSNQYIDPITVVLGADYK